MWTERDRAAIHVNRHHDNRVHTATGDISEVTVVTPGWGGAGVVAAAPLDVYGVVAQ